MKARRHRFAWAIAAWLVAPGPGFAQQAPAVNRGVDFLKSHVGSSQVGETALAALAMIKAEVPPTDPTLAAAIRKIDARFNGSAFQPERAGGTDVYEAAVVIMALANFDANGRKAMISSAADHIAGKQNGNGSWDYSGRSAGDCSISQYAVLGLWEAENAGVPVSPRVWDSAARWYLSVQRPGGSWSYHPDEAQYHETMSMTAAGVGSLLICQRQLASYRRALTAQNQYLQPITTTELQRAKVSIRTTNGELAQAINAGLGWISKNFTTSNDTVIGPSPFYCLYGIERIGALAGRENLGRVSWYDEGSRFLSSKQQANGSWNSAHGEAANTAWAVLFLTKSTAKTVERITIRRLGAGELYGGKGLPRDLSSISEAGGRLIARPMDGAIEGMLTVLEDPRSENADSALAGLLARYQAQGPKAILPYRDRFRKLLTDRDPGVRRVAAWALSRMGDLGMVPVLIEAIKDPDEAVVAEARNGLQLLGRKIEGFGPASPSTPEQREAASKAWKAWYESVRSIRVDPAESAGRAGR